MSEPCSELSDIHVAFDLIGQGMRLRIPKFGGQCELVEGLARFGQSRRTAIPVSAGLAFVLCDKLHKIARDTVNQRVGWLEAGYDGGVADWYCHIQ